MKPFWPLGLAGQGIPRTLLISVFFLSFPMLWVFSAHILLVESWEVVNRGPPGPEWPSGVLSAPCGGLGPGLWQGPLSSH